MSFGPDRRKVNILQAIVIALQDAPLHCTTRNKHRRIVHWSDHDHIGVCPSQFSFEFTTHLRWAKISHLRRPFSTDNSELTSAWATCNASSESKWFIGEHLTTSMRVLRCATSFVRLVVTVLRGLVLRQPSKRSWPLLLCHWLPLAYL